MLVKLRSGVMNAANRRVKPSGCKVDHTKCMFVEAHSCCLPDDPPDLI